MDNHIKYQTYSAEYKAAKIEEFLKSGKSELAFTKENGLCLTTFRNWRQKAGITIDKKVSDNQNCSLLEVTEKIQDAMSLVKLSDNEITFVINGFKISIQERDLKSFLRGMLDDRCK